MRCPSLKDLPAPPKGKTGWPWTEETPKGPEKMPYGRTWPKISIVTCNYNFGQYIEETIRSVLLQGYPDLEYIVMDGGSTDGSVDIIKKYEKWLTHWESEKDEGQGHAINKGFKMATGEIINWINSDDLLLPGALSCVAGELDRGKGRFFVYGDCRWYDEKGDFLNDGKAGYTNMGDLLKVWSGRVKIWQPAIFYYRSLLEEFGFLDESLYYAMDYDLWLRFLKKYNFHYVDKALAIYRRHPEAKISHRSGLYKAWLEVLLISRRYWLGPFSHCYYWLSFWSFFIRLKLRRRSKKFYSISQDCLKRSKRLSSLRYICYGMLVYPPHIFNRNFLSVFLRAVLGDKGFDILLQKHVHCIVGLGDRVFGRLGLIDMSQYGETKELRRLIKKDFPRHLVDVGAHDGRTDSVSYGFIASGWNAILVEPLPKAFARLSERYREEKDLICVNKACSNVAGRQKLFFGIDGDAGRMSTICTDENDWYKKTRTDRSIIVEVDTLTNILVQNKFPADFGLLLVDAEGMDYEVLLGLDFDIFKPRIIITEEYRQNVQKHKNKYKLLKDKGYVLHKIIEDDSIWIRKDLK
ncbi:MAG: FkbM family methyltransferase [Candidatus Omnitrophica bacterium]|nr:FkbM family methyltransferase [Candidatus Omnitrophota bacterium]